MDVWRAVGRLILIALDALAAGAIAGLLGYLAVPLVWVDDRLVLAGALAGHVAGVTGVIALGLAGLGRRPFPATRLARAAVDRLPLWWP